MGAKVLHRRSHVLDIEGKVVSRDIAVAGRLKTLVGNPVVEELKASAIATSEQGNGRNLRVRCNAKSSNIDSANLLIWD